MIKFFLKYRFILLISLAIQVTPIASSTSFGQNTKLRLFKQTTGFDSIVTKRSNYLVLFTRDTMYFHTRDTVLTVEISDLDTLNEISDSAYFLNDTLYLIDADNRVFKAEILTGQDNFLRVNQLLHGYTVPAYGVLPLYFDTLTGQYELALADSLKHTADVLMTRAPNINTIEIQNTGYLNVNHGLPVGVWYILDTLTPGNVIPAVDTCENEDHFIQYLFYTSSPETILLQPEKPLDCPNECPDDFSRDWNEGFDGLPNNSTVDNGPTSWSRTTTGTGETRNDFDWEFYMSGGTTTWLSEEIDVYCHDGDVEIFVDYREESNLDGADNLNIQYRLDGGAWIDIVDLFDDFGNGNATVTVSVSGVSNVQLRAVFFDSGGAEDVYLEQMRVRTL